VCVLFRARANTSQAVRPSQAETPWQPDNGREHANLLIGGTYFGDCVSPESTDSISPGGT